MQQKKNVMLFAILLAPITALIIPSLIYSGVKEDKKDKAAKAKRERMQVEEVEYRNHTLATLRDVIATKPDASRLDAIASFIGNSSGYYLLMQYEDNYPAIMEIWKKLSLPKGTSLHVEKCQYYVDGSKSELFVETPEGAYDLKIWDYITVDNSEEGAWEAYLLYNLWRILPLFGHANYNHRYYLLKRSAAIDRENIKFIDKGVQESLREAILPLITSPEVVKANGRYFVSCCYFSNFEGLIRETVEVTIKGNMASLHEILKKVLIQYECGVRF